MTTTFRSAAVRWVLTTMGVALAAACCTTMARAAAPVAPPASAALAATPAARVALVTQDQTALRAAPRDSAALQTQLWRGEALELRAEQGDHVQVWDHRRERGGWVRASQLLPLEGLSAPELLAMLHFVRDTPGAETMGLGLATAALQAAPPALLNGPQGAALLDAMGRLAERLADRATTGASASARPSEQAALSAQLEVAARLGYRLPSLAAADGSERQQICYGGDAFARVLAAPAASPEQRARATLALTRSECMSGATTPTERERLDQHRTELLDRVGADGLPALWKQRLALRRAAVWASLAHSAGRRGDDAAARMAAERAIGEIGSVPKGALGDDDLARFNEAAIRVNAVRWAALPMASAVASATTMARTTGPRIASQVQADGQTCVRLLSGTDDKAAALAERCTWGRVFVTSASANREGNALALAVQPLDAWRELWLFHKPAGQATWAVSVLPPAAAAPGVGYAEFAGWVPGGRQLLVAREAVAEGRAIRRFELMGIETLVVERVAFEPGVLGAFERWQDPAWKRATLALR